MKKISVTITLFFAIVAAVSVLNGCNNGASTPAKFTITGSGQ